MQVAGSSIAGLFAAAQPSGILNTARLSALSYRYPTQGVRTEDRVNEPA
jgi:hypothetical protein